MPSADEATEYRRDADLRDRRRASVQRRRAQAEFVARGLRSRQEAHRTGDYVEADVVVSELQRKLDAARKGAGKSRR
ncbi:MAG: hypothetical protein H0T42_23290 [Deltaproteobacteria bacterium]|nr:hypothetical protein [Deltaproteobacteria bacterium]